MAFEVLNPTISILDVYQIDYTKNRVLSSAYTFPQLQSKYPFMVGWCIWAGYTSQEMLKMDELSFAVNDACWKQSRLMHQMSEPTPNQAMFSAPYGKGKVILPYGRFDIRFPLLFHPATIITSDSKRPYPYVTYNQYQITLGTCIFVDLVNFVGAPANPSAAFQPFASEFNNRKDPLRCANWNNYGNVQYEEGFEISNIFINGGRKSSGSWNDPSFKSAGIAIWDPGETSLISNVYIEDMNTDGIEAVYGTPATIFNTSVFRNGKFGLAITGGGGGHSLSRVNGLSGDDNGLALHGIRSGYGRTAGGNIILNGSKSESLGSANYTDITTQGIPGKGQLFFDTEDSTHNLTLTILGGNMKSIGCALDSPIRIGTALPGTRTTVNCVGLYLYGNNAFKHLLQVGGTRYTTPGVSSYMGHSFNYTSNQGSIGDGLFITHNEKVPPTVLNTNCTGRLGWLPWVESNGTRIGDWNYVTCQPGWNPQTGISGGSTPPPSPVLTRIDVLVIPSTINNTQTSQASANGFDQYGSVWNLNGTWSIESGPATINSSGLVKPNSGSSGTVRVKYTSGSIFGTKDIIITTPPVTPIVTSISVSVSPLTAPMSSSPVASAIVLDQNGGLIPNSGVWSVDSGFGAINSVGVITPTSPGTIIVRYTQGGISSTGSVTITPISTPPSVPSSVSVSVVPNSLNAGDTANATSMVLDQYNLPMSNVQGTWTIQSGVGATINSSGYITTSVATTLKVRFMINQNGVFGEVLVSVSPIIVNPPTGPLFSLTFAGKNVLRLPGCKSISSSNSYRSGRISGSVYSTNKYSSSISYSNTQQILSSPISGVRRIVLKKAIVKNSSSGVYLNDKAITNTFNQFIRSAGPSDIIIGSFNVNSTPTDINIDFGVPQTITTLFGNTGGTSNTMYIELEGIELWPAP